MRQFQDDTLKVYRYKTTSGNLKALVATATADATVQPLGKGRGSFDVGVFGSMYQAFVEPDTPAQVGDRVKDHNGVKYDVTDVILRDFGAFPYKELILKKT